MNENGQIVTKDFAKRFVDHRDIGTGAKAITELTFHHREGRFHIRALVVALQEFITLPHEKIKHVSPHLAFPCVSAFCAVRLECDERHRSSFTNRNDILGALSVERAFDIGLASETNLFLGRCL